MDTKMIMVCHITRINNEKEFTETWNFVLIKWQEEQDVHRETIL